MDRGEWKDVADETRDAAGESKDELRGSPELPTLSEAMTKAQKDGYTESFKVSSKGLTTAEDKDTTYFSPEQVRINNFHRFEGTSDPQDNTILYLVQTDDG